MFGKFVVFESMRTKTGYFIQYLIKH